LLGPSALPGRRTALVPPIDGQLWPELLYRLRHALGEFETIATYQRVQIDRPGMMLLLLSRSGPLAFVKIRRLGDADIGNECDALRSLRSFGPRSFSVPEVLLEDTIGDWNYLALEPLAPRMHRVPKDPPLRAIIEDVRRALTELPRGGGVPSHWCPMHGDLTPTNLRELPDRRLVLFDWEEAGWGPPGADAVLYRATVAALGGERPAPTGDDEAIDFWLKRITSRSVTNERDRRLARALLGALTGMRTNPAIR